MQLRSKGIFETVGTFHGLWCLGLTRPHPYLYSNMKWATTNHSRRSIRFTVKRIINSKIEKTGFFTSICVGLSSSVSRSNLLWFLRLPLWAINGQTGRITASLNTVFTLLGVSIFWSKISKNHIYWILFSTPEAAIHKQLAQVCDRGW